MDGYIRGVYDFFGRQTAVFKKKALEIKSNSYGGREVLDLVAVFVQNTKQERDQFLENVKNLFKETGRTLSEKQYNDLKSKCTKPFICGIDTFSKTLKEEFEWTSSPETSLFILKESTISIINGHIDTFKLMSSIRLDKALRWSTLQTIIAGISLLLSVVAIIISIFKP